MEKITAARDALETEQLNAWAAAYKAALKSRAALVKQLQEGEEAWRKKALNCYADIANTTWQACRRWQDKEHELELATMRAKYGPRLDARASVEGAVAASLAEARLDLRLEKAKVAGLKEAVEDYEEVERERDELRAMVDALEERIEVLSSREEEGRKWRARAMQHSKELVKERAENKKAHRHLTKVKEGKQPKQRVEGEEEKGTSPSTMYRRATTISNVILDVFGKGMGNFGRMWGVVMKKQDVKDAFSEASLKPYHEEADGRETAMVDRLRDVVQWAKAHCGETHGRQVYEAICTAVADPTLPKDGGTRYWVIKRLGIGVTAMLSGMARRKVLDESCFREGLFFNDDRYDIKTKNGSGGFGPLGVVSSGRGQSTTAPGR